MRAAQPLYIAAHLGSRNQLTTTLITHALDPLKAKDGYTRENTRLVRA
jgi:hypothetical protein